MYFKLLQFKRGEKRSICFIIIKLLEAKTTLREYGDSWLQQIDRKLD